MIFEDFIMLGKTIPEPQKKTGRVFVCSAGYSHEYRRLMRIYPLAKGKSPPRWSVSRVSLERNPQDSREESWQLRGDRSPGHHDQINRCFEILGSIDSLPERAKLMQLVRSPSIEAANARRKSLCIIEPRLVPVLSFEENPDSPDHPQLSMFDDDANPAEGARRFAFQPYLEFIDEAGRHRLQVRDWGGYEFMRKQGDSRRRELGDAWHLEGRPCLLVGNMNNQRTVWLVISVLMPLNQMQLDLEAAE